jgi:hypothetical protein
MEKPPVLDIDSDQRAWAAGLFEGEGSIGVCPRKTAVRLRLQVTSVDLDVVMRLTGILGGKVYGPYQAKQLRRDGQPKQPHYLWTTYGAPAEHALTLLLPWFGKRRKDAARRALAQLKDPAPRTRDTTTGRFIPCS